LAQALFEELGGEARSAGSHPEKELHRAVVEAMQEIDLDISDRRPKPITDEDVAWAEVVVTMGCGDACPVFPGKQYVDWNIVDPVGLCLEELRETRDDIARRAAQLRQPSPRPGRPPHST